MSPTLGAQEEFDLGFGVTKLPFRVETRGHRGESRWLLLFTLLFGGSGAVAFGLWQSGAFEDGWLMAIVLAGLAILAAGMSAYRYAECERWHFTHDYIECDRHDPLHRTGWRESLSAYIGVMRTERLVDNDSGSSWPHILHLLRLEHATDDRRSVELYSSHSSSGLSHRQAEYARLFDLAALTETEAGVERRSPEDLGKSVRRRVAEGSLDASFDPANRPPGRNLAVRINGTGMRMWSRKGSLAFAGRIIAMAMFWGGILADVVFCVPAGKLPVALFAVGTACLVLGLAGYYLLRACREELLVSPREVRRHWRFPWGTFRGSALRTDEIEDVVVQGPSGGKAAPTVCISSSKAVLRFGVGLSAAERVWVRDCIIAVISK